MIDEPIQIEKAGFPLAATLKQVYQLGGVL